MGCGCSGARLWSAACCCPSTPSPWRRRLLRPASWTLPTPTSSPFSYTADTRQDHCFFLRECWKIKKKLWYQSAITTEETFFLEKQCWGSESGSFRMFLSLPNPDPLIRGTDPALDPVPSPAPAPDPLSSSKNSKKTFFSPVVWLLYDFLSLKYDVNVALKSNEQKNLVKKIKNNF